jgi:hypothetical protein
MWGNQVVDDTLEGLCSAMVGALRFYSYSQYSASFSVSGVDLHDNI